MADSSSVTVSKAKSETNSTEDNQQKSQIPAAEFVEDVDKFMQEPRNASASAVMRRFEEQHAKYKLFEANIFEKKKRLRRTVPELQKSLDTIDFLKELKDSVIILYMLASGVYGFAEIQPTEKFYLWLGANVMLEYPIDEAAEILGKNLRSATNTLQQLDEDLGFISDQCTTLEVAMTRVYNWDVKDRREKKKAQQQKPTNS